MIVREYFPAIARMFKLTNMMLMSWHIKYRTGTADFVDMFPSPELAIEAACGLMDAGCEVYGVGTESPADSIGREEIDRIYTIWQKDHSVGRIPI